MYIYKWYIYQEAAEVFGWVIDGRWGGVSGTMYIS